MDRPEHLEQQMWEFVYGLLPDDQAEAIRGQITADPDVARSYADVKLRSELVAEASRLRSPPMQFQIPIPSIAEADIPAPGPMPAVPQETRPLTISVVFRWGISIAAALLVGFVGYAYLKPHSPLRPVAFQALREDLAPVVCNRNRRIIWR
jgi:anti-sigma factor RsiW